MKLMKLKNDWNRLVLVFNGHIAETREVIPSGVDTVVHLGINDVGNIFDQIAAFDNYERPKYRLMIRGEPYIFRLEMAKALLGVVHQAWFDYEWGEA